MNQDNTTLSLHIAVCDDNIADRKQLERLLQREGNQRMKESVVFYIDSYGNADTAMRSPRLYDAFFIDITAHEITGSALGQRLLQAGVSAPLIFCISSLDYRQQVPEMLASSGFSTASHPIFYLDKPIRTAELSAILDHCISQKSSAAASLEFRCQQETHYVKEDDVVYVQLTDHGSQVVLRDGKILQPIGSIDNLYLQLSAFPHFLDASPRLILNIRHICHVTPFQVSLSDASRHPISLLSWRRIRKALHEDTDK